jgi:hypothetical protein
MSLLPDDATFHERVQALFAHYRGRGVALSAKDVELVEQWADAEVPFEVVARGMRLAAEKALWDAADGTGRLDSLRACKRSVDAELKKRLKLSAGKTERASVEVDFVTKRLRKLRAAKKKLARSYPVVGKLSTPAEGTFDTAERLEHLILAAALRSLPFPRRLAVSARARGQVRAESPSARREELRFHRSALVRHELGLPRFW